MCDHGLGFNCSFVHGQLLTCLRQVQFSKNFGAHEGGQDVVHYRHQVGVVLQSLVQNTLIVRAKAYIPIGLHRYHDQRLPCGMRHWFQTPLTHQVLKLFISFGLKGEVNPSGLEP